MCERFPSAKPPAAGGIQDLSTVTGEADDRPAVLEYLMAVQATHGNDAQTNRMDGHPAVGVEDVTGVRSRVSWPAILAGTMTALALSFLLALLGGAIGLSVSDRVDGQGMAVGAAVFAVVTTILSLFAGGVVASQLTAGENKREAALYGGFVWAAVMAAFLFLAAGGVKAGFGAMVGLTTSGVAVADTTAQNTTQADWEEVARRAGYSQQQLNEFKERVKSAPADAKAAAEDPATRQKAEQAKRDAANVATRVTWWTFAGALLSLLAAVAGGFVGAGPTFRLFAVPVARTGGYDRR